MSTTTEMVGTTEVARMTGVTFRVLDYWDRNGAVNPTIGATGSGSRRGWATDEVAAVAALGRVHRSLREIGVNMPIELVRQLWEELRCCGSALVVTDTVTIEVMVENWGGE